MEDNIGEEYDGIISSVTNFGMFVELSNTIEGLVHVSYMTDDYYHFDDRQYAMIGERTAKVFRIGDEITVRVINVNKDERAIDFEIVGMKDNRQREGGEKRIFRTEPGKNRRKDSDRSQKSGGSRNERGGKGSGQGSDKKGPRKKKKFYENAPSAKRKTGRKKKR